MASQISRPQMRNDQGQLHKWVSGTHFVHFGNATCIEQDSFCKGCLPRVYVSRDANVANVVDIFVIGESLGRTSAGIPYCHYGHSCTRLESKTCTFVLLKSFPITSIRNYPLTLKKMRRRGCPWTEWQTREAHILFITASTFFFKLNSLHSL